MPTAAASSPELSKLTVPQLKLLCKERKLTGYSKLGKNALLQKLAEANVIPSSLLGQGHSQAATYSSATSQFPRASSSVSAIATPTPNSRGTGHAGHDERAQRRDEPNLQGRGCAKNTVHTEKTSRQQTQPQASPATTFVEVGGRTQELCIQTMVTPGSGNEQSVLRVSAKADDLDGTTKRLQMSAITGHAISPSKAVNICAHSAPKVLSSMPPPSQLPPSKLVMPDTRKRPIDPTSEQPSSKKAKTNALSNTMKSSGPKAARQPQLRDVHARPLEPVALSPVHVGTNAFPQVVPNTVASPALSVPGQRFKPLVIVHKLPPPSTTLKTQVSKPRVKPSGPVALFYLDIPPSAASVPSLSPIGLPPSIANRKHVLQWAIILSGLDDQDRRRCVLVSKMFRYAVYLSAGHVLQRDFHGKRLDTVLRQYPQAMTDLWPYLRLCQQEAKEKQRIYSQSFLPRALKGRPVAISKWLWGSPDNERQLVIALRFVMTRFWFALSIGGEGSDAWLSGIVVDAQEILAGEIWSVKVQINEDGDERGCKARTRCETFYVLEATCEVVGRPPAPSRPNGVPTPAKNKTLVPLRADWSAYIHRCLKGDRRPQNPSMLSHLKWANYEEYDRGISKLWLQRVAAEGAAGKAKHIVASRYVLACVVGNSISGTWKTTAEMAQDFAGLLSRLPGPNFWNDNVSRLPVNLYLPEHHHVESVHFETSRGEPLHPALAVVQTPGREYIVLKDNGMQVGCEEDGVATIWMEILQCNEKGLRLGQRAAV